MKYKMLNVNGKKGGIPQTSDILLFWAVVMYIFCITQLFFSQNHHRLQSLPSSILQVSSLSLSLILNLSLPPPLSERAVFLLPKHYLELLT